MIDWMEEDQDQLINQSINQLSIGRGKINRFLTKGKEHAVYRMKHWNAIFHAVLFLIRQRGNTLYTAMVHWNMLLCP